PASADNISCKPATTDKTLSGTDVRPCRILLVDDTPDVLKIHDALLKHMHHESVTAENGKQALDLFLNADEPFDLLITDFRMPVMNGLELIEQVRKEDADLPIIMITAFGEDEQLQQTAKYGVKLMNKPVTLEKLKRCIQEALVPGKDAN
ncbi:MAG: response regulator, partial [Mariprofundaceae bacterium]